MIEIDGYSRDRITAHPQPIEIHQKQETGLIARLDSSCDEAPATSRTKHLRKNGKWRNAETENAVDGDDGVSVSGGDAVSENGEPDVAAVFSESADIAA
jgi:hypothetical protein